MSKTFPAHLDPESFQVADFDDPAEAFFWLGYFAGRRKAPGDPAVEHLDSLKTLGITDPPPEVVAEVKDVSDGPGVPLCELAEFAVLDTETSGLSSNDCAVQMAIGFFRADGSAMGFYSKYWKLPTGCKMSPSAVRVHKITASALERDGVDAGPEIRAVHRILQTMKRRGKRIVAHNASFDVRMLKQTAAKTGFSEWYIDTADIFCTMQSAKALCGLVSVKTGRAKAPSNSELYQILVGETPQGPLHDAMFDIKVRTVQSQTLHSLHFCTPVGARRGAVLSTCAAFCAFAKPGHCKVLRSGSTKGMVESLNPKARVARGVESVLPQRNKTSRRSK